MWTEELVIHPLVQDHTLVGHDGSDGSDGSDETSSSSFLVHARFQLSLTHPSSSALVPSPLDPWMSANSSVNSSANSSSSSSYLDVSYTRGNLGTYRVPSWYGQRAPGLVVRMDGDVRGGDGDGDAGGNDGYGDRDGAAYRRALSFVSRVVGASASSMVDGKSYVVDRGGRHHRHGGVFVGFLTQDFPCVESVARWLRLLPCGGQVGVGGVVRRLKLLELPYHSVRVVVDGDGGDGGRDDDGGADDDRRGGRTLTVEVSGLVHDARRGSEVEMMASRNSRMNEARIRNAGKGAVLGGLLDEMTACPVVERSVVHPGGCGGEARDVGVGVGVAIVRNGIRGRVGEAGNPLVGTLESVIRLDGGEGSKSFSDERVELGLRFRQVIPWEVVVDASSLKVELGGVPLNSTVRWVHSVGRGHAGLLEVDVDVARRGGHGGLPRHVVIGLNVERPILSVHDYPADMSRGIDIPAPEVTAVFDGVVASTGSSVSESVCLSSSVGAVGQNVLFQMPIPDASMPFNVACFTATLLSLLFGAMMPVLLWEKEDLKKVQSAKYGIKARLKRLVVAALVGGVAVFYLDNASRAAMTDAYESIVEMTTSLSLSLR